MFYQIGIAVGGMVTLVSLFVIFQLLADRMRALNGECRLNTLRCLGCLASGRCRQERGDAKKSARRFAPGPEPFETRTLVLKGSNRHESSPCFE